jgi:cation:H+ antiporter
MTLHLTLFIIGLLALYYSAGWLVKGSSGFARHIGLQPVVIGLTVVAFGTSAPELMVSIVSSIKGKSMIAVGNIIGSNVFNILAVLGAAALAKPISIPGGLIESGLAIDYAVMTATSVLPLIMMNHTYTLSRKDGVLLLLSYVVYIAYLVMKS